MHLLASRRRVHLLLATLFAITCAAVFSPLVTAEKAERPPDSHEESSLPSEAVADDDAVFSHRKLLQTAIAKTGAPVYRFVECRHLPKEMPKLVQVGLSSTGLPIYRVQPGDFCLFTGGPAAHNIRTQVRMTSIARRTDNPSFSSSLRPGANTIDLNNPLSPVQQYACDKFGTACRIALAVQLAENPSGACEIYHYNVSDGTLDWGYFQINSVHLKRPGLNLKDLLDCRANIDYAYTLFSEKGFAPWSAYKNGAYRKFLGPEDGQPAFTPVAENLTIFRAITPH